MIDFNQFFKYDPDWKTAGIVTSNSFLLFSNSICTLIKENNLEKKEKKEKIMHLPFGWLKKKERENYWDQSSPVSLQELVGKFGLKSSNPEMQRRLILSKAIGRVFYTHGINPAVFEELNKKSFIWFVGADFINQLQFHAWVTGPKDQRGNDDVASIVGHKYNPVVFRGDLPEFATSKIILALEAGIKYITIHSNKPFPEAFQKCQGILLGWENPPFISITRKPPFKTSWLYAVIISAFDFEKEIEFPASID